ncbi:MAG: hypothetical protein PHQ95_02150 [Candidatus Gracilibacteria bacterium]|nr:hypothetical protein [Candidatus Gracilibacteria bacterium]
MAREKTLNRSEVRALLALGGNIPSGARLTRGAQRGMESLQKTNPPAATSQSQK